MADIQFIIDEKENVESALTENISLPQTKIAEFCRRWKIQELAL